MGRDYSIVCATCGGSFGGFNGPEFCGTCEPERRAAWEDEQDQLVLPLPAKHMTALDLAGWKAVIAATTRGTWTADKMTDGSVWVQSEHNDGVSGIFEHIGSNEADVTFITVAQSALPAAIQCVEELDKLLASALVFIDEINVDGCAYKDGCPSGARHYVCLPCRASREAARLRSLVGSTAGE